MPTATPTASWPSGKLPLIDMHFHANADWPIESIEAVMSEMGVIAAGNGTLRYDDQTSGDEVALAFVQANPGLFFAFGGQVAVKDLVVRYGASAWTLEVPQAREYVAKLEGELSAGQWAGIGELFVDNENTHPLIDFEPTNYPADSPLMQELWRLSSTYHLPISVHMEAEPTHIREMERLLASDGGGTWVWAHAGYFAEPDLFRRLFAKHENLFAELSWRDSVRGTKLGLPIDDDGTLRPAWKNLLEEYSDRFSIGTDVTAGALHEYEALIRYWRVILDQLSPEAAANVAYHNAQRLLSHWSGAANIR